jgi:hypothetical protein
MTYFYFPNVYIAINNKEIFNARDYQMEAYNTFMQTTLGNKTKQTMDFKYPSDINFKISTINSVYPNIKQIDIATHLHENGLCVLITDYGAKRILSNNRSNLAKFIEDFDSQIQYGGSMKKKLFIKQKKHVLKKFSKKSYKKSYKKSSKLLKH